MNIPVDGEAYKEELEQRLQSLRVMQDKVPSEYKEQRIEELERRLDKLKG